MPTESKTVLRDLVAEVAQRLSVDAPPVRFVEGAATVRWDAAEGLRVPARVVAHHDRFGTVPTSVARDVAFAMAKTAARRSGTDDAILVEVEALSFAEAFVRDRVLNG